MSLDAEYEGGFPIRCDGDDEGGVYVASRFEDVHLSISTCAGFTSATTTVNLSDDQILDLQLALTRAMAARAVARQRRIAGAA